MFVMRYWLAFCVFTFLIIIIIVVIIIIIYLFWGGGGVGARNGLNTLHGFNVRSVILKLIAYCFDSKMYQCYY